ncbi:MAG TPA: hypothetical protein VF173_24350 [Thermoanaerobaculia bacterium]|nr:hypothetical protein [Thermoanaerobaculia bacterium]
MDEKHTGYDLKAPGPSGASPSLRLPGHGPFPSVDDHLVAPEVTRDEIIGGRRVVAQPAKPPHAIRHNKLSYVLDPQVAPGYTGAADLLTRLGQKDDFASDVCVFKDSEDPATGDRHLEEIAFEVVSEQSEADVSEKAVKMHRRGVRRIFAVWVKGDQRVCEWLPETRSWRRLEADSKIEDPCLMRPLVVGALLDAAIADNEVAEALVAKGNPVIQKREDAARSEGEAWGRAEGKAEGKAEDILKILELRGVPVGEAQRQEISSCRDLEQLDRWFGRALVAVSADEVTPGF